HMAAAKPATWTVVDLLVINETENEGVAKVGAGVAAVDAGVDAAPNGRGRIGGRAGRRLPKHQGHAKQHTQQHTRAEPDHAQPQRYLPPLLRICTRRRGFGGGITTTTDLQPQSADSRLSPERSPVQRKISAGTALGERVAAADVGDLG